MIQLALALYYKLKLLCNRTLFFFITFLRTSIQMVLTFYTLVEDYDYKNSKNDFNYNIFVNTVNLIVAICDNSRCAIIINLTGNLAFRTVWKEIYQTLLYGYFIIIAIVLFGYYIGTFIIGEPWIYIFIIIASILSGISYIFEIITIYYTLKRSKTEKGVVGPTLKRMAVLLSIATIASFVQYLYVDAILILNQDMFPNNEYGIAGVVILLDIMPVAVILITFYRIPPTRKSEVVVRGTDVQKPLLEKNDTEKTPQS